MTWQQAIQREAQRREFPNLIWFCDVWFPCMVKLGAFRVPARNRDGD